MEKRRLKLTIPCQALAKTLYYLLCLPFNLTAPVGVGPDVDLSAPPEAQNAWEKKKKAEAEAPRKYWSQKTGELLVMTPAEKEERDESLRLEAVAPLLHPLVVEQLRALADVLLRQEAAVQEDRAVPVLGREDEAREEVDMPRGEGPAAVEADHAPAELQHHAVNDTVHSIGPAGVEK